MLKMDCDIFALLSFVKKWPFLWPFPLGLMEISKQGILTRNLIFSLNDSIMKNEQIMRFHCLSKEVHFSVFWIFKYSNLLSVGKPLMDRQTNWVSIENLYGNLAPFSLK